MILDASVIGGFLSKTYITSLFDLYLHKLFVKLKFNHHFFVKGQAYIYFLKAIYEQLYLVSPSLSKIIETWVTVIKIY